MGRRAERRAAMGHEEDHCVADDEREQLTRWARRAKSSQALALRSRIVFLFIRGLQAASFSCSSGLAGAGILAMILAVMVLCLQQSTAVISANRSGPNHENAHKVTPCRSQCL